MIKKRMVIFLSTETPSRYWGGLSTLFDLGSFTIYFFSVLCYAALMGCCGCDICDVECQRLVGSSTDSRHCSFRMTRVL